MSPAHKLPSTKLNSNKMPKSRVDYFVIESAEITKTRNRGTFTEAQITCWESETTRKRWRIVCLCTPVVNARVTDCSVHHYKLLRWNIRNNLCFLTLVVTVINGGVHFLSVVRIRAISLVLLLFMCGIIYPLQTSHCPLNHLAFRGLVSQQKKWRFRRKEDRFVFISVCSTTEVNFCEPHVSAIRIISSFFTVRIAVFPKHPSKYQALRARSVSFVNTVFPCNEMIKIQFRKKIYRAGSWIKHRDGSGIFQGGWPVPWFSDWMELPLKIVYFEYWNLNENCSSYSVIVRWG